MKDRIFAALNLSDKEIILYDKIAGILEKNIAFPDLIIFLQSDTERLMENIKKRGRDYEANMDWNYIDSLNQIYNEFFFRYDKSPLLIINTNDIDFVNDKNDLNEITKALRLLSKTRRLGYMSTSLFTRSMPYHSGHIRPNPASSLTSVSRRSQSNLSHYR